MSRMILLLARTLEPPPVDARVEVYGIDASGAAHAARVVDVDTNRKGITVELDTDAFGARRWHVDLPLVK